MSIHELSLRIPSVKQFHLAFDQFQELTFSAIFWLTAFTLLASMLLGGGTRPGFFSDVLLQLLSIPLLLLSASRLIDLLRSDAQKRRQVRWETIFCVAVVLLPIIQLVPLPPSLWTLLPNRASTIAVFDDLNRKLPWMPISVSPNDTWLTLPALIPPLAVYFGTVLLNYRERRMLSLVVIVLGIVSAFLGLMQMAQGPASSLRFFTITNETDAVGFFANRNHFAALLNVLILFAAAWAIDIAFDARFWHNLKAFEARSIAAITASLLAVMVLLAAQAMTGSRAGMILMIVSLVGIYALVFSDRRHKFTATPINFLFVAAGTAILLAVQFGLYRALQRLSIGPLEDSRVQFVRTTLDAVRAYLPFGSGLGTFVPVYEMFEKIDDLFAYRYLNHAHNDIVEFMLEAGVFAIALLGGFVAWLVSRAVKIWLRGAVGARELDRLLARAAIIAIALVLAHSVVDYPLRTAAMMGVFVFACALSIEPLTVNDRKPEWARQASRAVTPERVLQQPAAVPVTAPSLPATGANPVAPLKPPRQSVARWGEDVEWPEAWRQPSAGKAASTGKAKPANPEEPETG